MKAEEASKPVAYVVLFEAEEEQETYSRIVVAERPISEGATIPSLLSDELIPALPAAWYALHLPRHLTEAYDLPPEVLFARQRGRLPHRIVLMPIAAAPRLLTAMRSQDVHLALLVGPDDRRGEIEALAEEHRSLLGARCYSDLHEGGISSDWERLAGLVPTATPANGPHIRSARNLRTAAVVLPASHMEHQFEFAPVEQAADIEEAIIRAIRTRAVVSGLAHLVDVQAPAEQQEELLGAAVERELGSSRFPVVISLGGVAPQHRHLYPPPRPGVGAETPLAWPASMADSSDTSIEALAASIMVTHEALATSAVGLALGECGPDAFVALAQLEDHWVHSPRPRTVWRLLGRLSTALHPLIEDYSAVVRRASQVVCFANFPVGLMSLPGTVTPLMLELPVTHRQFVPLTNVLAHQVFGAGDRPLIAPLKVLIIECIPLTDVVGQMAHDAWDLAAGEEGPSGLDISIRSALSVDELKHVLTTADDPDVLVISAHGFYDRASNVSGFLAGDEPVIGHDLDGLPPLVILSACHVSPRGVGAVTVVDMLLRAGAAAVLGTMVPVDVRHNSIFMVRFLLYLSLAATGEEPEHDSVLDVWHRVQAGNVINDVLFSNSSLSDWATTRTDGHESPLEEFMNSRSVGRVRLATIYEDCAAVLTEIADERGVGNQVRRWLQRGVLPETCMYVMFGAADRLRFEVAPGDPPD